MSGNILFGDVSIGQLPPQVRFIELNELNHKVVHLTLLISIKVRREDHLLREPFRAGL